MPKTLKIFISSTFRDMNAERDVLIKNVFPRLRERAEELGVFIREVDLRWGVTEEQARRGEALEICLEGIEECRPYFVCMLGKRYGWIPPPDVIRVDDFTKALGNTAALTETDIALLRSFYRKAGEEERVFTLDRQ